MMNRNALATGIAALVVVTSALSSASAVVITEVVANQNSQYVQTFDGGQLDNGGTTTRWTHIASAGGTSIYDYNASATPEGFVNFTSGTNGDWDFATYDQFRVRMSRNKTNGGDGVQIFPNPVGPAGSVTVSDAASTSLHEVNFDLSTTTANGTGFRIDPWNYTNDASADRFEIDYAIADRSATIGVEYDHDGDTQGLGYNTGVWSAGPTVSGGVMSGTAAAGGGAASDVQINLLPLAVDPDTYKFVELRMKGFDGDRIDFFYSNTTSGVTLAQVTADSEGIYKTFLLDFTGDAGWSGTFDLLRLDPAVSSLATFEVDYIRFYESAIAVVPAPAALPAGLAMMLAFAARRRRK